MLLHQMGELEADGDDRGRGRCPRHRDHRTCCRFCSILTCVTCSLCHYFTHIYDPGVFLL